MHSAVTKIWLWSLLACASHAIAKEPAHNFKRWEKQIVAFEESDKKKTPPKGSVVFVGSSSIRGWKLDKSFPKLETINRGFGGSEICDATHFFDRIVAKHRPRIVVLYAGDNDIARGKSAEEIYQNFVAFAKKLRDALPETELVFISIKPSLARWKFASVMKEANKKIAVECKSLDRVAFVDIWQPMLGDDGHPRKDLFVKDGLHMTAEGYAVWAKQVLPFLTRQKKSTSSSK